MPATSIVYFGDSLTDNGNLYALGEGILPDSIRDDLAGPTGAVSDGPTHAAYTGDLLGVDEANYAIASAEATGSLTLGELIDAAGLAGDLLVSPDDPALDFDINLSAQVARFLDDCAGQNLARTEAYLLIGGNDFQNLDFTSPSVIAEALALIEDVIAAQVAAAQSLFAAGVGAVWLAEIPAADFFAGSASFSALELAAATLAADTFNSGLADAVSLLQADGFDVRLVSTTAVTDAIVEDPTGFGLLAPYADTQLDSDALDHFDPDQVAFYDDIHPSTATHGVLGAFNAAIFSGDEAVSGGEAAETLEVATSGAEGALLFGLGGDDILTATGAGSAVAFGGTGNDFMTGGAGGDLLSGGDGDDVLNGRAGNDVLNSGLGDDIVRGMRGADVIVDSLGDDLLRGGKDDDLFIFTEAALLGGTENGTNVLVGGEGIDTLVLVLDQMPSNPSDLDGLLADLGLRLRSIETVELFDGRDALDALAGEDWYAEADAWGLI